MTDFASLQNHQVRLAARPVGMTTRDNWQFTTETARVKLRRLYPSIEV